MCGGYAKDGHLILQADHLMTRSNAATYAGTRLIACVCKAHHDWKSLGGNMCRKQYDTIVRKIIGLARAALWDRCEQESWRPKRTSVLDWKRQVIDLEAELHAL